MAPGGEVAFELERFEWVGEDRLEVVGRWQGMSGRRLARPVLFVEAGGHRRRLTAMPGGRPPAAEGELWKAVFGWTFGADDVVAAELEVARSIVVDLPPPRTKRRVAGATSPTADIDVRREIEALKAQVAELTAARDAAAKEAGEARAAAKAAEARADSPAEQAPPAGVSPDEHEAVVAELAAARTELEGAKAELSTARTQAPDEPADPAELAKLRAEQGELGDQLAALRAQNGELRHELGEALDGQERVAEELRKTRELQMESDRAREQLMAELSQMRADLRARDEALERARVELAGAAEEAEKRLEAERAATADLRAKLADAREEAQRGLAAEAEETERLRTELGTTREEAERTLAMEREETSRLRAELSEHTASDTETTDGSGRRMYESIAKELERERTTVRDLRRELDSQKAQSAEQRRAIASAVTNGVTTSQETPLAATPAGRSGRAAAAMAARADAAERSPLRRAEAARAAAAQRVPEHHNSPAGVWAVRATALVLVAVLLVALIVIISSLA
jgi:chromosome segregation ATPase